MADDIFEGQTTGLTGADWRKVLERAPMPSDFEPIVKPQGEVQFAKQLFKAQDESARLQRNMVVDMGNDAADAANQRYREITAAEKLAARTDVRDTKANAKALAALPVLDPDMPELPQTWDETKAFAKFDTLPYKQQAKVLGAFKEQEALRRAKGDLATNYEEHAAAVDKLLPDLADPSKVKRSAGDFMSDLNISVAGAYGNLAKSVTDAISLIPGMEGVKATSDTITKAVKATESGYSEKQKGVTAEKQKQQAALVDPNDALGTIVAQGKNALSNFDVTDAGQVIGNVIPMVLGGMGLAAIKVGAGGITGAQAAFGSVSTAGELGGGARDAVMDAKVEDLKASPLWSQLKKQGLSDLAVRNRMAEIAGREAGLAGAAIGLAGGVIGAKFGGEAAVANLAVKRGVSNVLGKTAVEAGTEAIEEGGGQATQNAITKQFDTSVNVASGVGSSAVLGAVGGGVTTAGAGTLANFQPGAEAPAPTIGGDAQPLDITQGAPAPAPNTAKEAARARAAEALGTPLSTATENVAAQAQNLPVADQLTPAEQQAFDQATAQARGPDNVEMPTGAFTTQADIDALYTKTIEDMYIATDTVAATENVAAQATNAPAAGQIEATQPAPIDRRTEMVGKLVTAYADQSDLSSAGTIRKVDAQLEVLGEEPLTQDERAKTDRILGAARTFAVQPRLPSDPTAAVSPIDQGANSGVVDWRAERDATALASKPKAPSLGVVNSLIGFSTHSQVTPEQRTNIAQKFVNGTLTTATQNAIDATGFGLTVQGGASVGLEWARVAQEGGEVLTHLASDAKQTGEGVNAQARAVIEMYRQSGTPLPTVSTVDALPITSKLGTVSAMFQPTEKTIVATPGTAAPTLVHEYLHGVTYEGLRAAAKTKEGRETLSLMRWVRAQVNMQAAAENKERPYATTDNDELLADMFNPEFLVLANNTPIGKPADAGARAALERIQGNSSTIAQLINRIIETLLRFAGVTPQANSVATIMGGLAAQATALQAQTQTRGDVTKTPNFKAWFGDSKVVDAGGKPLVMYHGTSATESGDAFTSFDTYASNYGLMGMGGYFTADPAVASSYTTKGKGASPTVYPVYLAIKNPMDMDGKADTAAWKKQFDGIEPYHNGGETNEAWYRAAEESLSDQDIPRYEGAEIMQDGLLAMGFDGATHIGGGRVAADGVRHQVYIAFDPEQIKSSTGNNGSFNPADPDIRMSVLSRAQAQAIGVQSTNDNTSVPSTERLQPLASARSTAISEPEMQSALDGLARAEESRFNTGTRRLYSDGGSPLPYTRRMGSSFDGRVSALGRAFGVRVAVVQVRKGFESLYGRFEAVVQPSTGILLIKDTSQRPHLALLGHETVHVLKTENPALYEEFRAAVEAYVNSGTYQGFAATGVARMSDGTEAGVKEEFLAEVVSDGFTNEAFWEALGNKNPSLLRYVMQTAKTLISNARFALIGKKTRTGDYLTDFDAVMKIAGEAMGKFSDSRGNSLGLDLDTTPSAPLPAVVRGNRESVSEILDDINSGAPAQAATPIQALYQAAKAKDAGAIRETLAKLADNTNTAFHDNIAPAKNWLMSLAVPDVMRQKIVNLLYLAPGRRDALQTEVMEKHGGADMHKAVYALANDAKVSYETASLWTGNWLTAKRAEATNQMLIDRDTQAAKDATTLPEAEALRLALEARIDAVFDPDLTKGKPTNPHLKGVAGGMSNAQAAATIAAVEKKLDPQRLAQIAEHIYSMNAYRLALDVETGRATPEVVAKFLNNPAVEPLLTQLAAQGPRATDALRQQVRDAVRSDYVPMTGHPLSSIDGDDRGVLSSGTVQPNVSKTHSMDGRTIGVADDGISTTLEGVIKSATFAGFADFTTEIGAAYDTMTAAERAQAGISRVNINGLTRLGDNVILDGRTQNRIGYALDDRRVLESLRKANVEDTNRLLSLMSVPTSMFAYAATQLNPTFAFTNVINDTWERNVIMKTRDFFKPDGTKIDSVAAAERMKFLLLNGSAIASVNRHLRGKPNMNNPMDVSLHDLIATGGLSLRSDTLATNTASAKAKGARGSSVGRRVLSTAGDWIQAYNKSLDLVAPLLSYQVLRDAGLDRTAAAGGALDLMNFRKKGTIMALVSANYAFAQPAVTGGANMVKALATRSGRRQFGVYLVISMALRAIATALADEDEGGNVIDQRPEYERDTKYLFQFGGYVAKLPAGFGLTRLANNLSSQIRDIYIGKQGVAEGALKFLNSGIVPAISPLEDTKVKDPWTKILHLLSPTIFKPIVALSGNTTSFGAPINNEQWINAERYRHLQGNPNTAEFYRDVAKGLHEVTGEDASPEAVKHVINSYSLGAFRIALNAAVNNPDKEAKGKPTAPAILSPVLAPVSEAGKTAQFYEAQSELLELTRREDTGEKLVGDDKQLAKLRDEWKEKQDGFAKETKAETKKLDQRQITETLLTKRKADIQKRKSAAQDQWLVKWRRAKGL